MAQTKKINLIPFRKNPLEYADGETAYTIFTGLVIAIRYAIIETPMKDILTLSHIIDYLTRTSSLRIDTHLKTITIPADIYEEMLDLFNNTQPSEEALSAAIWLQSALLEESELWQDGYLYDITCGAYAKFQVIGAKYSEKWLKYYEYLVTQKDAYNPLDDNSYNETRTGNNTDKTTYDITQGKKGTNKDTTTYNTETEDNGNVGTNETTTRTSDEANDVYGFNSATPVGDSTSKTEISETTTGTAETNTTHNLRAHTGTDTKDTTLDHTETKTGTDAKEFTVNEKITRSGRNTTGAELLQKELDFRSKNLFWNMVFDDIDRELCIQIY